MSTSFVAICSTWRLEFYTLPIIGWISRLGTEMDGKGKIFVGNDPENPDLKNLILWFSGGWIKIWMVKTNQKVAKCLNVEVDHIYIYMTQIILQNQTNSSSSLWIEPARPSLKIAKHLVEWIALDVSWQRQTKTTPKVHTCWRPKKLCCKRNPKSLKVFECFVAWMGWAWRKDLTGNWPYPNFEMSLLKDFESQFRCSRFSKSPGWSLWFITSTISTQEGRARISKKSRLNLQQKGLKVLSCKKKWYRT